MDNALNTLGGAVRRFMLWPARAINRLSGGRIKPNHVTLVSLLGHLLVVWALWQSRPVFAAVLLAFFGLMDSLDGALARLQKTSSLSGMMYDAVSDRIKEILLYIGIALFYESSRVSFYGLDFKLLYRENFFPFWIIIAVCGLSLVVSYIKAKGEMALSSTGQYDAQKLNRLFSDGVGRYEVRMALIIIGFLTGMTYTVLHILLIILIFTCLQRLIRVSRALKNVQS